MLAKRDKILKLPWEQKRYENHIKKVKCALPIIDNKSPPKRSHVFYKDKKSVQELERIIKIKKDNFLLLSNLCDIWNSKRMKDYWDVPPPNFLNRVTLYDDVKPKRKSNEIIIKPKACELHLKRSRCSACISDKYPQIKVPEERIPWEPPKDPISHRWRSQSVPAFSRQIAPILNRAIIAPQTTKQKCNNIKTERHNLKHPLKNIQKSENCLLHSQEIILKKGHKN